jgi:hypothetical protein
MSNLDIIREKLAEKASYKEALSQKTTLRVVFSFGRRFHAGPRRFAFLHLPHGRFEE